MAAVANQLYNNGLGILGDHPEVALEMVGIDPKNPAGLGAKTGSP